MNKLKTAFQLFFIIGLTSCSSQKEIKKIPFETQEVYFQKWIGGQELTGSGINFYLKFSEPFSANFLLKKVYFQGKEASFQKIDATTFTATFYQRPNNQLDGSENETSKTTVTIPNFVLDLNPNEAIVVMEQDNKVAYFKISNIKEKELIAYPSAKPRN